MNTEQPASRIPWPLPSNQPTNPTIILSLHAAVTPQTSAAAGDGAHVFAPTPPPELIRTNERTAE